MNPSSTQEVSPFRQNLPVYVVACLGLAFTLTVFVVLSWWERQNVDKAFRLAAEERANAVSGAFETELAMLNLVRSALVTDDRIEEQEFREILEPFLTRSSGIHAVEWAPRVSSDERPAFETEARKSGIERFSIMDVPESGTPVAAAHRDEYFPIRFIGPQAGNHSVYGIDLASEPTRFEPLKQARDSGRTVASGQFTFIQDEQTDTGRDGFMVCLPVYRRDKPVGTTAERRENLAGFVLGVFRPNQMIDLAIGKLQAEGIDVGLYDPSNPASDHGIHFHVSRMSDDIGKATERNRLLDPKGLRGLRYEAKLDVAGHPWTVVCVPTPEFLAAHHTWWPAGVSVIGLVFTGLMTFYVKSSVDHRLHLEEKVREQTADIRSSQEDILCRLTSAAQLCDEETEAHIRRVGLMSQALARAADWFGPEVEAIRQAAQMHDIGKIGVPDAILKKAGELTQEESEILRSHTRIGAEILGGTKVPMLQMAHEIALAHHERWDGKGYPRSMAGKTIPECARIVAIVDTYDTLTHAAAHHPAMPHKEALDAMRSESEHAFDPNLLTLFLRHIDEMQRIAEQHPDRKRGITRVTYSAIANTAAPLNLPATGVLTEGGSTPVA